MHLHIVSAGWGFGPTAAQMQLVNQLNGAQIDLTLDVPERALAVVHETLNHVLMLVPRKQQLALKRTEDIDLSKSVVINFGRTDLLAELVCKAHYFVDCAAWQNYPRVIDCGLLRNQRLKYLIEFFPPLRKEQAEVLGTPIQPCLRHVNRRLIIAPDKPGVLITVGGGITPRDIPDNPLVRIVHDVIAVVRDEIRIVGGEVFGGGSEAAISVSHEHHLSLMTTATMVLTVPGLYTVFEALQRGGMVALLPPTNYTQLIQYSWYRSAGMVHDDLDWTARCVIPASDPESISSTDEMVLTARLRRTLRTPKIAGVIKDALVSFLLDRPFERLERLRSAQQAMFKRYVESGYPSLVSFVYERL